MEKNDIYLGIKFDNIIPNMNAIGSRQKYSMLTYFITQEEITGVSAYKKGTTYYALDDADRPGDAVLDTNITIPAGVRVWTSFNGGADDIDPRFKIIEADDIEWRPYQIKEFEGSEFGDGYLSYTYDLITYIGQAYAFTQRIATGGHSNAGTTAHLVQNSHQVIKNVNLSADGKLTYEYANSVGVEQLDSSNNIKGEAFNDYTDNVASGTYSHAEGKKTTAKGNQSHSEGENTYAIGKDSHAEGYNTYANGNYSHAGGLRTKASYEGETAIGAYNNETANTLFAVGNGTSNSARSNAFEIEKTGNTYVGGTLYAELYIPERGAAYVAETTTIDVVRAISSSKTGTLTYQSATVPTKKYVDDLITANDALRYCGTVLFTADNTFTLRYKYDTQPADTSCGAVYKVIVDENSYKFLGVKASAGDMFISYSDAASTDSTDGWNLINENLYLNTISATAPAASNINHTGSTITYINNVNLSADGTLTYQYGSIKLKGHSTTVATTPAPTTIEGATTITYLNNVNLNSGGTLTYTLGQMKLEEASSTQKGIIKVDTTSIKFSELDKDTTLSLSIVDGVIKLSKVRVLAPSLEITGGTSIYRNANLTSVSLKVKANNYEPTGAITVNYVFSGGVTSSGTVTIDAGQTVSIPSPSYAGNSDVVCTITAADTAISTNKATVKWAYKYRWFVINSETLPTTHTGKYAEETAPAGSNVSGFKTFTATNSGLNYYWIFVPSGKTLSNLTMNGLAASFGLENQTSSISIDGVTYKCYRSAATNSQGAEIKFKIN